MFFCLDCKTEYVARANFCYKKMGLRPWNIATCSNGEEFVTAADENENKFINEKFRGGSERSYWMNARGCGKNCYAWLILVHSSITTLSAPYLPQNVKKCEQDGMENGSPRIAKTACFISAYMVNTWKLKPCKCYVIVSILSLVASVWLWKQLIEK